MLKQLLLTTAILAALAGCSSTTVYGEVGGAVEHSKTVQ